MAEVLKNFIGGHWKESTASSLNRMDPTDSERVIGVFPDSNSDDVEAAVTAGIDAAKTWKNISALERQSLLLRAAILIEERSSEIAKAVAEEMGKPISESKAEVLRAGEVFRFFAGEALRICGETYPTTGSGELLFTLREPLGLVGLITPWNFPLLVAAWKIGGALAYGNTVVLKPSENTPFCGGVLLGQVFEKAGFPKGVFNVILGGPRAGCALVNSPKVSAVSFTGSGAVGKEISSRAAQRMVKVQLEMGGKNALIILEDADLGKAANLAASGAMSGAGQKCTATSRAIVLRSVASDFIELLLEKVANLRVGLPLDEKTQVGPLVNEGALRKVENYVKIGQEEGALLQCGGKRFISGILEKGYFFEPTVFTNVSKDMRIAQDEIFGPVLCVMEVENLEQGIEIANDVDYGLSASICTSHAQSILRYIKEIEAGVIHVNSATTGAEPHVPFGGYKGSSSGSREAGHSAMEFYTQEKTVYFDSH